MALIPCKECGETISTEADACPKCGAKVRKSSGCGMFLLLLLGGFILLIVILSNLTPHKELSTAERYPPPWRTDINVDIVKVLVKNDITGCAVFKYRPSSANQGEYLVYGSPDGETEWAAYIVWIPINKVEGPFKPDPSLEK